MAKRQYISANEIADLFHRPNRKKYRLSGQILVAGGLIGLGLYFLLNAPALSQQLRFWWESDIQAAVQTTAPLPIISEPVVTPGTSNSPTETVAMADNSIYIPKLNVRAPIIWDVTGGKDLNSDLLKALERGVARYPQTALPDQVGNVFLTGHSSNYWWEKGQYKTVFALLNRLVVGDVVMLKYQGKVYTYKVNGQKVVKPTETSVLNPTQTPTLSLMTCTPTGTSLYRRIVTADLISPTEDLTPQPTQPNPAALQSVR